MTFAANLLLAAGALGAGFYCHVLARRLKRFTDLETGVGGAVAVLSAQVDDLDRAIARAREQAKVQESALGRDISRAESAARRLELLVASLHDLPEAERDENRSPGEAGDPVFSRQPAFAGEER